MELAYRRQLITLIDISKLGLSLTLSSPIFYVRSVSVNANWHPSWIGKLDPWFAGQHRRKRHCRSLLHDLDQKTLMIVSQPQALKAGSCSLVPEPHFEQTERPSERLHRRRIARICSHRYLPNVASSRGIPEYLPPSASSISHDESKYLTAQLFALFNGTRRICHPILARCSGRIY